MHELSIAISIVEMAEEESEVRGRAPVSAVHLKLGVLAGVVKEALLSSYDMACAGTPLEGSRLVIEEVPAVARCSYCGEPRPVVSLQKFLCSECGRPVSEIVHGQELEVFALELQT